MSFLPRPPRPNPAIVDPLWVRFLKSRQPAIADRLLVEYFPFVQYIANRLKSRLPRSVDVDDLFQVGAIGARRAIDLFDPKATASFLTFSRYHIRGAMLDWLRMLDWRSRDERQKIRLLDKTIDRLTMTLGRMPSDPELAEALRITLSELSKLRRLAREDVSFSTDAPQHNGNRPITLMDKNNVSPQDRMTTEVLREHITRDCNRSERLILILYYYENLTMREIGAALDLSESRVSQMHSNIIQRIRAGFDRPDELMQ